MVMIPALGNLQKLILEDFELTHGLPFAVAQSLTSLTELRLSISFLTPEISLLTTLQVLHMKAKGTLRLEMKDVDTVAGLPRLRTLVLQAESGATMFNWFKENNYVLVAMSRRKPSLNLVF